MRLDTDRRHIWHPYASAVTPPPVIPADRTSGNCVYTEDGRPLVDGISSWWCASFGHRPEPVVRAIHKQAERMPHVMFAGITHGPAAALADRLKKLLPEEMEHFFYADSGSIAVECALKMAIQYQRSCGRPRRTKTAALRGGYHGDTVGAMSVSDPGGMHAVFGGLLPEQYFADRPKCPFGGAWKDEDFSSMAQLLETRQEEIASVIVEPVFQAANAMWFYHPEYLRKLRAACDRYDIVLIFDEIATGFGRTGKPFALNHAGVAPDIMCIGKALTAGCISLGCTAAKQKIASGAGVFLHGPTFMANPLACAAASAALDLFCSFDWCGQVSAIEKQLKRELESFRNHPLVRDVRVLGAAGVLETEKIPPPETVRRIVLKTGVWLRPFARFVYTMPPFTVTPEELTRITNAMGELLSAAGKA
ncbi:MAG: adenosylmethionine--8-amino-7-oxononanoate transaminase [Lentisphaeria bacterium]|nr:adenosylmethionine--8-amino-7-oxononanoate transaminase [Lentisphaeria bacterium]